MINIDGHTFDHTRLQGGWVIDAGCRGFKFTNYCLDHGKVYALDIEDFSQSPDVSIVGSYFSQFIFKHAALTTHSGQTEAHYFGDGTGNFLKGINEQPGNTPDRPCENKIVKCITLDDIYAEIGTSIDVLKLDIEGAEYTVLENIEPIPKQITVEFHQHCHHKLHDKYIDKVINHLCKDYALNLYITDPRYKYNDCLFIRKDLA
jgi:FkbM family methyltransferase